MPFVPSPEHQRIFENIYEGINGFDISFDSRSHAPAEEDDSLTYGEVTLAAIEQMLTALPSRKGVFYDLGSGTGKAVLAAALVGDFTSLTGVELLPELFAAAELARRKFIVATEPFCTNQRTQPDINFILGDLVAIDYSDADVVFIPSTCYSETLMSMIRRRATMLRAGAILITVSQTLQSSAFELYTSLEVPMSWGKSTIFIYTRR